MYTQNFRPRMHLTHSDFASITEEGRLCDHNGHLGPREFEVSLSPLSPLSLSRSLPFSLSYPSS